MDTLLRDLKNPDVELRLKTQSLVVRRCVDEKVGERLHGERVELGSENLWTCIFLNKRKKKSQLKNEYQQLERKCWWNFKLINA